MVAVPELLVFVAEEPVIVAFVGVAQVALWAVAGAMVVSPAAVWESAPAAEHWSFVSFVQIELSWIQRLTLMEKYWQVVSEKTCS